MKISRITIIRTIVLVVALINQVLTIFAINPLPYSENEIYEGITAVITVIASLVSWWKNNSFTKEAIMADDYMQKLKESDGLI